MTIRQLGLLPESGLYTSLRSMFVVGVVCIVGVCDLSVIVWCRVAVRSF